MLIKRTFRHWTPRYIRDRLAVMVNERLHPDAPWLTQAMVAILDSWLRPTDRGLEWGSGRSTMWFARRVAHLVSVEHNSIWGERVRQRLQEEGLAERVDYRLQQDGKSESADSAYVRVANDIPQQDLDFCLVDGVARDHCVLACLDLLRPGGILIVDNTNWYVPRQPKSRAPNSRGPEDSYASEGWRAFAEVVQSWRCIWTTNGVWDTALWVKSN